MVTAMNNYKPFVIYSNISKYLSHQGYRCDSQNDLISAINNNDEIAFQTCLYETRECIIESMRAESNKRLSSSQSLTSYERMTAKWNPVSATSGKTQLLVYFHTPVVNAAGVIKKVAKNDTVTALKYLILSGCKNLLFVHGPEMISAAHKQLSDPLSTPSNQNYKFEIKCASLFDICTQSHIFVPKHEIVENYINFLEEEGLDKSKMPKISIEDPAIRHLGAKVGDIIRIYRNEDFSDVSSLFYREVTSNPMEIHKSRKK